MGEIKKSVSEKGKENSKTEVSVSKNRPAVIDKSRKISAIKQIEAQELLRSFDEAFEKFRSDFGSFLFPSDLLRSFSDASGTRVPAIDLEDREKDFVLRAEMPGFKKQDIVVNVEDDAVEIAGEAGWKYDDKQQAYICKERACSSFYRYVSLPEEIKIDQAEASVCDGVLEIVLPKKAQKQKRQVAIK